MLSRFFTRKKATTATGPVLFSMCAFVFPSVTCALYKRPRYIAGNPGSSRQVFFYRTQLPSAPRRRKWAQSPDIFLVTLMIVLSVNQNQCHFSRFPILTWLLKQRQWRNRRQVHETNVDVDLPAFPVISIVLPIVKYQWYCTSSLLCIASRQYCSSWGIAGPARRRHFPSSVASVAHRQVLPIVSIAQPSSVSPVVSLSSIRPSALLGKFYFEVLNRAARVALSCLVKRN